MSVRIMAEVWHKPPVSQGKLLVLLALADNADEDTRRAWPSVKTLARKTVLSERQVQYCLKALSEAGVIEVLQNAGPSGTNVYHIYEPSMWGGAKTAGVQSTSPGGEPDCTGGVQSTSPGGVKPIAPEPSIRTIKEPSKNHNGDFDAFWAEVPKKVGKGQAVKAYRAALKKADAETILSGIRRYAKERAGKDPQYTAHPATWLNGERWADAPVSRPADFHDRLDERLKHGPDLRGAHIADSRGAEQLPAPIQSAGTHGRTDGAGTDQADGGSHEQAYSGWYRPRRFG